MSLVDDVLEEYQGRLSLQDILHLTHRELDLMRSHRRKVNERRAELAAIAAKEEASAAKRQQDQIAIANKKAQQRDARLPHGKR